MARRKEPHEDLNFRPHATTPEAKERLLISKAYDLAEKQLTEGSASAQVITHLLKLGTEREKLEREKLRSENLLALSKIEDSKSGKKIEELYSEAISAMREYGGQDPNEST